jgi:4-amino-4-deoxy-L-arabinose transferase-like glycosyltransferase
MVPPLIKQTITRTPNPLTAAERRILIVLSIAVALTRLLAFAQSMWDWDEGLFTAAVREYDVVNYNPHPPGYPLYVAPAKLFYLLGVSDFRALQLVTLLGAFLIFPAAFALAREMGFRFRTSIGAALLFSFLPNVWVYSGTGFSDVPGVALALLASALLLRGRDDDRAYLLGTLLLALSIGVRPQNILIGLVPGILATWRRVRVSWRVVAGAALIGVVVVGATYGAAALASGSVDGFVNALRIQADYVKTVDSWRAPGRPALVKLIRPFFLGPLQTKSTALPIVTLMAISLLHALWRRRWPVFLAIATFGPVAIFSWMNLDLTVTSRYSIAYMLMHAMLAADGIDVLATLVTRGNEMNARFAAAALTLFVTGVYIVWIWPSLKVIRTTTAPPVAAMEWLQRNVPKGETIVVHLGLTPQSDLYLRGYRLAYTDIGDPMPPVPSGKRVYYVNDRPSGVEDGIEFRRERGRLWNVVRSRNFEASITLVTNHLRFGAGWYDEEASDSGVWRWMSNEGTLFLPAVHGNGKLTLRFFVPNDTLTSPPTVTIIANGKQVDQFVAKGDTLQKSWIIPSVASGENEIIIRTSDAVNPRKHRGVPDDRDLGLRLDSFAWEPLAP